MSAPEVAVAGDEFGKKRELRRDIRTRLLGSTEVRQRQRAFGKNRFAQSVDKPVDVGC